MTNQYRPLNSMGHAWYGDEPFEEDFSPVEEGDLVARGLIEIVPRPYRTLTDRYTVDGVLIGVDEVVELALPVEIEAALVDAGILSRVRRDAHPTVSVETEDPDSQPARRRRTTTPIKE